LFSVVTFKNEECFSESSFTGGVTAGTCYTATECTDKSGTKSGNCASGFGVCCIIVSKTGASATIKENRTIIRNPLYPAEETSGAGTTITYTINKMQSDICQVRLDFDAFVISGPANTVESSTDNTAQTNCIDTLVTTLQGVANLHAPTLCGIMTGEHLYLDMGMLSTDTASLALSLAATTIGAGVSGILAADTHRYWSIRTSQIPCWAPYRAPDGCHRYLMSKVGQIISPNFAKPTTLATAANIGANKLNVGHDLMGQDLRTCIRREAGMCCVKFQVCNQHGGIALVQTAQSNGANADEDNTEISEGWSFHTDLTSTVPVASNAALEMAMGVVDAGCYMDYVEIPDSAMDKNFGFATQVNTRYCGTRFGFISIQTGGLKTMIHHPIYDCTEPLQVNYHTDNWNDEGGAAATGLLETDVARGFCLDFTQEAC
jgi:hypothetical protein